jgi:hypothetical protein
MFWVRVCRLKHSAWKPHKPLCIVICGLSAGQLWTRALRRRSAAARLLRLWVPIPPGARMSACCECCVLSGRDLCDEPITRPEKSYRLWCVIVCDLETSQRGPRPTQRCRADDDYYDYDGVASPVLQNFSKLSYKWHVFREKNIQNKLYLFIFSFCESWEL